MKRLLKAEGGFSVALEEERKHSSKNTPPSLVLKWEQRDKSSNKEVCSMRHSAL